MTTKPKIRQAPAKTKKAPGEPKREASKTQELIARWKWLEADQDYQTAIASPERDADQRHDAEQESWAPDLINEKNWQSFFIAVNTPVVIIDLMQNFLLPKS